MDESGTDDGETGEGPVSMQTRIEDGQTLITVTGDRNVAVVVNAESGERVYLPPETRDSEGATDSSKSEEGQDSPDEGAPDDSPYEGIPDESPYEGIPEDSPYEGVPADSPYEGIQDSGPEDLTAELSLGVNPMSNGFRVLHPEPVTDVRLLRRRPSSG